MMLSYVDMIAHQNIKFTLRGVKPAYSRIEVEKILNRVDAVMLVLEEKNPNCCM